MPQATHVFKNVNVKSRQTVPAFCHLRHHRFDFLEVLYTTLFDFLEKEMATHSSVVWRIPETEEPSGLPSMGSHRVGHD